MDIIKSAKQDNRWIELFYPEWGWRTAYWNGAAWCPPREGSSPTDARELTAKTTGE